MDYHVFNKFRKRLKQLRRNCTQIWEAIHEDRRTMSGYNSKLSEQALAQGHLHESVSMIRDELNGLKRIGENAVKVDQFRILLDKLAARVDAGDARLRALETVEDSVRP